MYNKVQYKHRVNNIAILLEQRYQVHKQSNIRLRTAWVKVGPRMTYIDAWITNRTALEKVRSTLGQEQ